MAIDDIDMDDMLGKAVRQFGPTPLLGIAENALQKT